MILGDVMSSSARRYSDRAPRYILNPQDSRIMRVATKRKKKQIFKMEIVDLSETGMSFVVDWHFLPQIGEILKVEFPVPGQDNQVAWFAKVVRLEGPSERPNEMLHFSGIKVGVEFQNLPKGHLNVLRAGLQQQFISQGRENAHLFVRHTVNKSVGSFRHFLAQLRFYFTQVIGLFILAAFVFGLIYYFNQIQSYFKPQENWGQKFFDRVTPKEKKN